MGAVVHLDAVWQQQGEGRWRQAGHKAVDEMGRKIKDKVAGQSFEGIGELLRQEGRSVTGAILQEVIRSQGAREQARDSYVCQGCGRILRRQPTLRSRTIESLHGEIEIERPYFYCKACQRGYQPFDETLESAPTGKQYDLQRAAAELFTQVPFERAGPLFERLTGMTMTDHCMQEVASQRGKAADNGQVWPSRHKVEEVIERAGNGRVWRPVLVVPTDGADLPTRPQAPSRAATRGAGEWEEAKGFRLHVSRQERIEHLMSWPQIATEGGGHWLCRHTDFCRKGQGCASWRGSQVDLGPSPGRFSYGQRET
jgi:hypothetical protein